MNLEKKQWTLESAQKDFRKTKRGCKNCEFTSGGNAFTTCHVKHNTYGYFRKIRAKMCKYYTPKEVR